MMLCSAQTLSIDFSGAYITNRKRTGARLSPCLTPTRLRNSCICLPDLYLILNDVYKLSQNSHVRNINSAVISILKVLVLRDAAL